jgi:signal transduction histidine kinase
MKRSAFTGVAAVAVLVVLGVVAGDRGSILMDGVIGGLAAGLFAGAAVFALFAYSDRRDPALLLVGVGSAAVVVHQAFVSGLFVIVQPTRAGAWMDLIGFSTFAGLLVLLGNLLAVVPWRERRGRPPLQPTLVIAASAAGLMVLDVLSVSIRGQDFGGLDKTATLVLLVGGITVMVRSLRWGGRFGWVAAAGLALAIAGISTYVAGTADLGTLTWLARASAGTQGLAAAALVAFVVVGLRMESTRSRRATDRATQVMEGRAEIASIVAHDVRGPAGTIRSVAGSLRTSYQRLGDAERLEFVGMIEQESLRLLRVADQMSLGLKTDAGTLAFTFVVRDLEGPVLQGLHDAEVGEREVRVQVDTDLRASIDARWLAEATRQGIENALKFSPGDTPIDLGVHRDGEDAVIEVTDRGPGIPPEMREQVFEKFCRWRPYGYEDRSGSGLGLFIARSIAREHEGTAIVVDGPDGGTILQIRVPLEGVT